MTILIQPKDLLNSQLICHKCKLEPINVISLRKRSDFLVTDWCKKARGDPCDVCRRSCLPNSQTILELSLVLPAITDVSLKAMLLLQKTLNQLLRKISFKWTEECEHAFLQTQSKADVHAWSGISWLIGRLQTLVEMLHGWSARQKNVNMP